MKNTAEEIKDSIVERLWKENERQEEMKVLSRRSILRNIKRVKGSNLSYEIKQRIEGIQELATLNAILGDLWNVKDINKLEATINKYDWLEEMKRLENQ